SQLQPVFTEQIGVEESLREARRQQDAIRLASIQRAKHNVFVYAWNMDHEPPCVVEFQDGYVWPNFIITPDVIADADLLNNFDTPKYLYLYRISLGTWTKIKPGHVIAVDTHHHIFLRSPNVKECEGMEKLLAASTKSATSHFRLNLQAERADVKMRL
ncbi:hypothetical protein BD779DRAFT_1423991, partial [Infundibulicybe gibba]